MNWRNFVCYFRGHDVTIVAEAELLRKEQCTYCGQFFISHKERAHNPRRLIPIDPDDADMRLVFDERFAKIFRRKP